MKINRISSISALIAAITFFLLSTIRLIYYGISQGAVKPNQNKLIQFIYDNYKNLNTAFLVILAISFFIILTYYYIYSKKNNQKILNYVIILLLLSFLFYTLSQLSAFIPQLNSISLELKTSKTIFSISSILFGIVLLFYKKNRQNVLLIVALLYIIQSLFVLSTNYIPIQLLDLMFAIRISEAVLCYQDK